MHKYYIKADPPPYKKLPGRPSRKKRGLEPGEKKKNIKKQKVGDEKVGKEVGEKTRCFVCRELGHNKRKYKLLSQHQALNQKEKGERHWRMTLLLKKQELRGLKIKRQQR